MLTAISMSAIATNGMVPGKMSSILPLFVLPSAIFDLIALIFGSRYIDLMYQARSTLSQAKTWS